MTYSEIVDLIDNNLASGIKIPAVDHREVETALLDYINDNLPKQFDIKYIWADATYLGNNFETNGLGKLLRLGWAICNGNNGTPNLGGRMILSYGGDFTTLNAQGGEKEHILTESEMPSHTHNAPADGGSTFSSGTYFRRDGQNTSNLQTSSTGGGLAHNNMPPYYTLIGIMKL